MTETLIPVGSRVVKIAAGQGDSEQVGARGRVLSYLESQNKEGSRWSYQVEFDQGPGPVSRRWVPSLKIEAERNGAGQG